MKQVIDIAKKLELTSIALGCLTRKELCAAFQRVNPNTSMTLQNSYNWQRGRSVPRNFSLFEDWAAATGLSQGPHFIMSSALDEFIDALGEKFALPERLLESYGRSAASTATVPTDDGEDPTWRNGALLRGSFLALSVAWSPMQRGRLLCGAIAFQTEGGRVAAQYVENVLGRAIVFNGSGAEDGKTGQVALRCEANGAAFLMAFHLPPLPGNLAGGVFAGNALYDSNSEPTACSLLLLRNHELPHADLEVVTGYQDLDESVLADWLERLGYGRDPERVAEREMLRLLHGVDGPTVSLRRDALGHAAILLDERRFAAAGRS
jgi:hypothetical protein